jgi:uncharacterized lipoprotein YajG
MDRIRLPLAALALSLLAACQSAAPTAPVAPRQPGASVIVGGDSLFSRTARDGNLIGSGN